MQSIVIKDLVFSIAAVCVLGLTSIAAAADLEDITNFHQYSAQFASAGQPTTKQLRTVKDSGFERVIYLAFTSDHTAIDDEDGAVKKLGMDYIHIPVDFNKPTSSDFYAFVGVVQTGPAQKTLLHCQVNFRASSFGFLYRVIYDGVDIADAKEDMNLVWQPNETWRKFIFEVLEENDISPECDICDWAPKGH